MSATFGGQSMYGRLRRVLVRRPVSSFAGADPQQWHYSARPDLEAARHEHDDLVELLRRHGSEIHYLEGEQAGLADSIYVFDPALVTDHGAVILSMGKRLRRGEEGYMRNALERLGVPILSQLEGSARAEAGDLLWLDASTLLAGVGFRTNSEGVRQLRRILTPLGVTVDAVDLPYDNGPHACLHLLSLVSLVDSDLAVVYPPLMPVRLWQLLERLGIHLIEVPDEEYATLGTNVLAISPRTCLLLAGNRTTERRLEEAGCTVLTYKGREISLKAEGGPTCLTRPLLRDA